MIEKGTSLKYWPFLALISIYFLILSFILVAFGYKESFLLLNGAKFSILDWPMFIITHLGDALILTSLLSILFIWKKPQAVVNLIVVVIITGLMGQLLKMSFFEGWDRPLRIFNESPIVHTLPTYRLFHNSFPSGHSITAMSAFTALVWSIRPKYILQLIIALIAILVSYSRVYLGVHFPGDVLAGSLFGLTVSLLLLPMINRYLVKKIRFTKTIQIATALIAFVLLVSGIWIIRIYFPLI